MNRENTRTSSPFKIDLNNHPSKQPEGTYRYAVGKATPIDAVSSIGDEPGNQYLLDFPDVVIGSIEISRYKDVIFLANNTIYILDKQAQTLTLHAEAEFGFNTEYPITGFHRVVRGCEDVVYFFDHINPDRFVNLSRPEKQQTGGVFDVSKFNLLADVTYSVIQTDILNSGGSLEYGVYNFCIEYLNENEDALFYTPIDINYTPIANNQNEGALNLSNHLADIGGQPKSNKSIKLTVSHVPEDAALARIIVFRTTTSDGFTSDAHVIGQLIPVQGQEFSYIYKGFNADNGDYTVSKDQYLVPKANFNTSLHGLQVGNKMLRYNLKETVRDYSQYQQKASKIKCKYVTKKVNTADPNYFRLNQTFVGGEIILPYINYIHTDGTISQGFPLVNRAKQASDADPVPDPLDLPNTTEKWRYKDTSILDTPLQTVIGYNTSGLFGYYESEQQYTNPPNFCGTDYWGEDFAGNSLQDTPVRLFVVPDRSVESHVITEFSGVLGFRTFARPIGIWFDPTTIEYPSNDIVSHFFSVAIVGQSNIDCKGIGVATSTYETSEIEGELVSPNFLSAGIATGDRINLLSGKTNILEQFASGEYVSVEGNWDAPTTSDSDETFKKIFAAGLPYDQIHVWMYTHQANNYNSVTSTQYGLDESLRLPARSKTFDITNPNYNFDFNLLKIDGTLSTPNLKYVSVKNTINPIPNIYSVRTRRITDIGEDVSFRGTNFITELVLDGIFDFKIEGFDPLGTAIKYIKFGPWAAFIDNEGKDLDAYCEVLKGFYVESEVNCELRHNGLEYNQHFQFTDSAEVKFLDKMIEPYDEKYKLRDGFVKFFPGYNQDYSYVQQLNQYFSLRLTYDFCSECQGEYKHRILYSIDSFDAELSDNMRVFLPNNFIDIPSDTGAIIGVDYKDNKLIVRTEQSCYFLIPNNQELQLSETTVNIGTGDFLSIPPQELNTVKQGYGGQQHKLDSYNTEQGLIWADRQRGEIYLLNNQFAEISRDLYSWFNDKLPLNSSNHLLFTYDKEHKRFLMTKKNEWTMSYCFKVQGWKSWHHYIPDWYLNDVDTFYSVYKNKLYVHNSLTYNRFYDLDFDSTIEFIVKDTNTFRTYSIYWHGSSYDKMIVYNHNQTTGEQTLTPTTDDNIFYSPIETYVILTDENYKASPIKDLASSSIIWTNDISSIKQGLNQGYADKLPVIDIDTQLVEQGDFVSKWIAVRLIKNTGAEQGLLHWTETYDLYSIR